MPLLSLTLPSGPVIPEPLSTSMHIGERTVNNTPLPGSFLLDLQMNINMDANKQVHAAVRLLIDDATYSFVSNGKSTIQ